MRSLPFLIFFLFVTSANASLIGRVAATPGGTDYQAYYDDVLDITWLADADYARTSGYDSDGRMSWDQAQAWVGSLDTTNHLGVTGWRLPTVTDSGAAGCDYAYIGTDCGYNVDTSTGEMASLFYDTLGYQAWFDTSGNERSTGDYGISCPSSCNTDPFSNVRRYGYWSGTEYVPDTNRAWFFHFQEGKQSNPYKNGYVYAWAVVDGDIAASVVPVPAAIWLFGSALAGLGWMRRKQTV